MTAEKSSTLARVMDIARRWFSLTRSELVSLLLVLTIFLIGLIARAFLR